MTEPSHNPPAVEVRPGQVPSHTPAFPVALPAFDPSFCRTVDHQLRLLHEKQKVRRLIYGPDADEWRPAHTPPDVRDKFQTAGAMGLRHFMAIMTPPTPSTRSSTPPTRNLSIGSSSSRTSPTPSVARSSPHLLPPQQGLSQDEGNGEEIGHGLGQCLQPRETHTMWRRSSRSPEQSRLRRPNCPIRSSSPASRSNPERTISTIPKTPPIAKRKLQEGGEYGHTAVPRKRRQFPLTTPESLRPLQQSPRILREGSRTNTACHKSRTPRTKSPRSHAGTTTLPPTSPEPEPAHQAAVMTKRHSTALMVGKHFLRLTAERWRRGHV